MSHPRTRNRESVELPSTSTFVPNAKGAKLYGWVESQRTHGLSFSSTETVSDVVTPNYKARVAKGEIFNNPFSYAKNKLDSSGAGFMTIINNDPGHPKNNGAGYSLYGNVTDRIMDGQSVSFDHDITPSLRSTIDLQQECVSKIDSSDFAFGEDALEVRETYKFLRTTLALVKNPLKEVERMARKIEGVKAKKYEYLNKRSRIKIARMDVYEGQKTALLNAEIARNAALAASSAYLQYRFAVTPLVRSVQDALEAYKKPPSAIKVRSFARSSDKVVHNSSKEVMVGKFRVLQTVKIEARRKANIMYTIKNPIHDFYFQLGLRKKDILPTLWAVWPLSFMVDRVFNISAALKGVMALGDPNLEILAASVSTKYVETTVTQVVGYESTTAVASGVGDKVTKTKVTYNRQVWHPNAFNTVPQVLPGGLVDSVTNVADLAALTFSRIVKTK